ncbi:MAG: YdcF family protein [Caulobacteraceae bacterium]|nr:YdcF family protein [Caulobacteraceae bacterium]
MKSLAGLLVVLMIWAVGLMAFAARVDRSTPAPDPAPADGVVALTGAASNQRIAAATRLLEAEKAKRMLVSGVNRDATREDIRGLSKAARRLYDCCVDLGFTAATTLGNAEETAEWARANRYKSLIVVTADYHMPRALLELRAANPGVDLQSYPVATPVLDAANWWKSGRGARLMIVEYSKYLAILGRETLLSLGPRDDKPAAKEAAPAQ